MVLFLSFDRGKFNYCLPLHNDALTNDIVVCTGVSVECIKDIEVSLIVPYHAYYYYYYYHHHHHHLLYAGYLYLYS